MPPRFALTQQTVQCYTADPMRPADHNLDRAWEDVLSNLLSEPLSLTKLGKYFGVSRHKVRLIVEAIPGIDPVPCGKHTRYRVPIRHLPPAYFVAKGLKKVSE